MFEKADFEVKYDVLKYSREILFQLVEILNKELNQLLKDNNINVERYVQHK